MTSFVWYCVELDCQMIQHYMPGYTLAFEWHPTDLHNVYLCDGPDNDPTSSGKYSFVPMGVL